MTFRTKLKNIVNKIKNAYISYGYTRTAIELNKFSSSQLAEAGISKQLLSQGAKAYPWRFETNNVVTLQPSNYTTVKQAMPIIPKVA